MLDNYFQHRTHLAQIDCFFKCPQDCTAPGCRRSDVTVEVTVFDLIGLARFLHTSVSSLFSNHCKLGLQSDVFKARYKRILIKIVKPCQFLANTHCTVHHSKPLNCVLFPEYHQIKGILTELSKHPIFIKFPCLQDKITIPDKKRDALKKLRKISRKEEALSSYFLFGAPSFIIDTNPLNKQLKRSRPKNKPVPVKDYERFIEEKLKRTGLFNRIMDKVYALDTCQGIESLFKKLDEDHLIQALLSKMIRPEFVHQLKKDRVRQQKRTLDPKYFSSL